MMEKSRLRSFDVVWSGLFFLLGIYILAEAFQMPLKDSYAGVDSVWYVSPALLPIIIGVAILLLSGAIFLHALKNGGWATLKASIINRKKVNFLSDANIRYAGVLVPLIAMVYLNITRIDFFITVILFLVFTISVFHLDDLLIMRKAVYLYTAEMGIILLLAIFGLDKKLVALFVYSLDIIATLMIASMVILLAVLVRKSGKPEHRKKLRQAMWMSFMTPVFIVPLFRFILRVPLPVEGAVVNLMSEIYYMFR
ncbi:MAG: hypothetical protein CVV53_03120 [Spirochaetae bacterium HGW-Spirochaetae-9]|nr:MAG: hypothetical protein CVV53_03120 [Spirochaetae bacterium HGW-Spirochaetae-9]